LTFALFKGQRPKPLLTEICELFLPISVNRRRAVVFGLGVHDPLSPVLVGQGINLGFARGAIPIDNEADAGIYLGLSSNHRLLRDEKNRRRTRTKAAHVDRAKRPIVPDLPRPLRCDALREREEDLRSFVIELPH
jgi:hypothetical protein